MRVTRTIPVFTFGQHLLAHHSGAAMSPPPPDPREQAVRAFTYDEYRATPDSIEHAKLMAAREREEVDAQASDYAARRLAMVNQLEAFCREFGVQVVDFELRHVARVVGL